MRRVAEADAVLQAIAQQTQVDLAHVTTVVSALHDVIDELFLDGFSILVPPFGLAYVDDPIATLFADKYEAATEAELDDWYVADAEATAQWLGVPVDEYLDHQVAGLPLVLVKLLDEALNIPESDAPAQRIASAVAEAWFDTLGLPRV